MDTPFDIADPALSQLLATDSSPDACEQEALAAAIDHYIVIEVQRSLPSALAFARALVRRVAKTDGPLLLSAHRAHARAALMSGQYLEAEQAYLAARALSGVDPLTRGRIDRTLVDVYMYLGRFDESRRRAKLAHRTFKSLGLDAEIAKTRVNYANLLHRQDRHREAGRLYADAARFFATAGDHISAARCYYNRANTLVQLFRFAEAEELYGRSAEIYHREGRQLDEIDARWGISWLHMLEGKFHIALRELHECESAYSRIGVPLRVASCELDRAEVYLNLNLFRDALVSATKAEEQFARLGTRYEQAKAAYYRARADFALGRRERAGRALSRAQRLFALDNNAGFLGAVHLLRAQTTGSPAHHRAELRAALKSFRKAQLPLWQAVCDLQSMRDHVLADSAARRLSRNRAAQHVPHIFAAWQTALGDKKATTRPALAIEHWKRAADRLDMVRAQLPPVELRSVYCRTIDGPHRRLVEAEAGRNPAEASVWSERLKTAGVWAPPLERLVQRNARRQIDQSLMALAAQVAALSRQISGSGERSVAALQESPLIANLQREVRQAMLTIERDSPTDSSDHWNRLHDSYRHVAQEYTIVQWYAGREDLIAFVHDLTGVRSVRYRYGRDRLERTIMQWRFLLESAALADLLGDEISIEDEHRCLDDIGEWLIKPLELSTTSRRILVLPEGELSNLPWAAVRIDQSPLTEMHQFVVLPSLRHYLRARQVDTRSTRVELFAGPTNGLEAVSDELQRIRNLAGKRAVCHIPCRRVDWPRSGSARIWHFSGHAVLNRDNPFYSSLTLNDGPLFAADLRLRTATVGLVTLAACQSGAQVALPGEESTGLVRSFLEMGARNVIAGHWPVADRATAAWMNAFYGRYFNGDPIADAAHSANTDVMAVYPSAYHWSAFSIFGAGT